MSTNAATTLPQILNMLQNAPGKVPSILFYSPQDHEEKMLLSSSLELDTLGISKQQQHDCFVASDYSCAADALEKLSSFLATKSAQGKRKVVCWPIQKDFNTSIQNKLLKTVEDAGEDYGFIFLQTFTANSLLPTLRSRLVQVISRSPQVDAPSIRANFAQMAHSRDFEEFQKQWEEGQWTEKLFQRELIAQILSLPHLTYILLEKLGQLIEWLGASSQWNNPLIERKYMLFQFARLSHSQANSTTSSHSGKK